MVSEEFQTQIDEDGDNGGGVAVATAAAYPDDIRAIGDLMANLKSSEATDLLGYLKTEYGIKPASGGVVVSEPIRHDEEVIEVKTIFDVVLTAIPDALKKLSVVKEVRAVTGLGLAESKALVDAVLTGTPKVVKDNLPTAEAEAAKKKIEDAGGKIELR